MNTINARLESCTVEIKGASIPIPAGLASFNLERSASTPLARLAAQGSIVGSLGITLNLESSREALAALQAALGGLASSFEPLGRGLGRDLVSGVAQGIVQRRFLTSAARWRRAFALGDVSKRRRLVRQVLAGEWEPRPRQRSAASARRKHSKRALRIARQNVKAAYAAGRSAAGSPALKS